LLLLFLAVCSIALKNSNLHIIISSRFHTEEVGDDSEDEDFFFF
jgi:hypothetical protein